MADVNVTHADCLRTTTDIGRQVVHNICNGTVSEVPWGSADWALGLAFIALAIVVLAMFSAMAISIIRSGM